VSNVKRKMHRLEIDNRTYDLLLKAAGGDTSHGGRKMTAIFRKILIDYLDAPTKQPDCDLCPECLEHCDFSDDGTSECCGAAPCDMDPDTDMER
jgi:hypothetical protein